jgi:SAM-dependent methyltransferase
MLERGFLSILVTEPRSNHHHDECKPFKYGTLRYDPEQIRRSGAILREKWNIDIPFLTGFKGLDKYMTKKQRELVGRSEECSSRRTHAISRLLKETQTNARREAVRTIRRGSTEGMENRVMESMKNRPKGPEWHREAVAGKNWKEDNVWDRVGERQLAFLKERGLLPEHKLLDVGCGALRAGVHFMGYLRHGNYYGIDKEEELILAGIEVEMPRYGVEEAHPHLRAVEGFSLEHLPEDVRFDFAIAHSIFTHIVPELIEQCLKSVVPRLRSTGTFFATYHRSPDGKVDLSRPLSGYQAWRKDERHLTQYTFAMFEEMAKRLGIAVENIGGWGHPFNPRGRQLMLAFRQQ